MAPQREAGGEAEVGLRGECGVCGECARRGEIGVDWPEDILERGVTFPCWY